ncbi:AAA family ATPase [Pseudodesulfovibrio piezophilus]|uniref:Glutamate synthase, large subunit n=1 Tax=Pseudodesulfovibrio piezophilus (strain DSM 21447 / JCM 15486 / C1TLV30) TaxID=1322246 RepID=M1WLR9_PSEP2|nr:AAA family ATPase [Pseudodesulfovibrio piezophilus]CCH48340.1 Glutamate synthase, large subunit [Pseudodesulfovibrio piezophilus C1TLV30]
MSNKAKVRSYKTIRGLVTRIRDDLNNHEVVLLYAYNGTGKTRLSMAFKGAAKNKTGVPDTLYFNAYTEDLFSWENDLENDVERFLRINSDSSFFSGFEELALEERIFSYLHRYADFDFKIDYVKWRIHFSRGDEQNIKVSRGEENIFIWCIFLAICELTIDGQESYSWVKNIYVDDPISSLDDNNAIAVASDLAQLLKKGKDKVKVVISSHHSLFFNVMWNEFRSSKMKYKTHFLHRPSNSETYTLQSTDETPFFHHVAMLSELQLASEKGELYTHHFNMLRSIMEKTATFFGLKDFSECVHGVDDDVLYARALNLLSHGKYSVYEPREMVEDTKDLFKEILNAFLDQYKFALPELTAKAKR